MGHAPRQLHNMSCVQSGAAGCGAPAWGLRCPAAATPRLVYRTSGCTVQQLTLATCLQVMLLPTKEHLQERVRARAQQGCHFMAPSLLADQLATLELPPAPHDFFYCLPGALPR